MANGLNTLNLIQVKGGVNIKQGDSSSVLEYELGYNDGSDMMSDLNLNGRSAKITLYDRLNNKKWTTTSTVRDNRVSFTINEALGLGVYVVDIDVDGHIFPSDREMYVRVHEGYKSYIDGRSAAVAVATAKNIADEAIRLALLDNVSKIRGPKGEPLKYKDLTEEQKRELRGPKGERGLDAKITNVEYDGEGNAIVTFNYDDSKKIVIKRGQKGDIGPRGYTGDSVGVASVSKSGTTNTVRFTDGKTMAVEDGKSVNVSSYRILDDGNTEITFTDGKKAIVKKGQDGTMSFADLTEEQRKSLKGEPGKDGVDGKPGRDGTDGKPGKDGKSFTFNDLTSSQKEELRGKPGRDGVDGQPGKDGKSFKFEDLTEDQKRQLAVPVVNDLKTGGVDKALSAEQGKVLADKIKSLDKIVNPVVMTAVIDQSNPNPLTCVTYDDDARMMEKGSPEWDEFFKSQLVLFKDGREVRELEDSELNGLKPEDGDVMVRFPRKGLRIKTIGEKVYVSMTNAKNDPDFKYYAHSRGDDKRNNFYLGAYLGFVENGKLRSISGVASTGEKTRAAFRTIAQANGAGYEQLAFYQWTFLQAMYVLKYGSLDSQTALGMGNVNGNDYIRATGETNGKGIDFGSTDDKARVRFQWVEDIYGTKSQWVDGINFISNRVWLGKDDFNDTNRGYISYDIYSANSGTYIKAVIGDSEKGFIPKLDRGSSTTYYCDYGLVGESGERICNVGGHANTQSESGIFQISGYPQIERKYELSTARLMYL